MNNYDQLYKILNDISPISKTIWDEIKHNFKEKIIKKGDHLFRVDDDVKDFYFLIDGIARYYYLTTDGKDFNKAFAYKKGHLLSSISSVIGIEKSPFSVEILSEKFTVLYIPYEDFINLGYKYISWHKLTLKIYEHLIIKKEKREADFLLLNATQRYEKFLQDYKDIANVIANYQIAAFLGITEVALSRIRKNINKG